MSDATLAGEQADFQPAGFAAPTAVGLALLVVTIALVIFFYSTPSPGPRVGRVMAILGPRPGTTVR